MLSFGKKKQRNLKGIGIFCRMVLIELVFPKGKNANLWEI